jgi:SH3-like domain-containing protein
VRTEPVVGTVIITLLNGSVVQVLNDVKDVNGSTWVRIRMENNEEGWVLQDVLKATTRTLPTFTLIPTRTP